MIELQPAIILRRQLIELLGDRCVHCDESDIDMLQVDHVADDGAADRKRFGSLYCLYRYYVQHPDEARRKLQVLCASHNWKKRVQQGRRAGIIAALSKAPPLLAPVETWLQYLASLNEEKLASLQLQLDIIVDCVLEVKVKRGMSWAFLEEICQ